MATTATKDAIKAHIFVLRRYYKLYHPSKYSTEVLHENKTEWKRVLDGHYAKVLDTAAQFMVHTGITEEELAEVEMMLDAIEDEQQKFISEISAQPSPVSRDAKAIDCGIQNAECGFKMYEVDPASNEVFYNASAVNFVQPEPPVTLQTQRFYTQQVDSLIADCNDVPTAHINTSNDCHTMGLQDFATRYKTVKMSHITHAIAEIEIGFEVDANYNLVIEEKTKAKNKFQYHRNNG